MSHKKKEPINDPTKSMKFTMPTGIASSVANAYGGSRPQPLVSTPNEKGHLSWYDLESLKNSVLDLFSTTADQFAESARMIAAAGGVERLNEYTRVVETASNDLERFSKELRLIMDQHEGKNGFIDNAEDHTTYMTIFEKYNSFYAHFQSTLHHVMLSMTYFAMEAEQRQKKAAEILQAEQPAT